MKGNRSGTARRSRNVAPERDSARAFPGSPRAQPSPTRPLLLRALLRGLALLLAALLVPGSAGAGALHDPPPPDGAAPAPAGGIRGTVLGVGGEPVAAATLLLLPDGGGRPLDAGESGRDGRFRIEEVPAGGYRLRAHRIGYREVERAVEVVGGEWREIEIRLPHAAVELEGFSVSAPARDGPGRARLDEAPAGTRHALEAEEMRRVPGLAETDPLRAIELLPGVISLSDFSSAFNVRGGSGDQNLVLLDGTPVFNPFHLGGLFSVFNADMLAGAELLSGGLPARHGGRVSSVLNVESDPGDGRWHADGGLSLLAARLAVGGGLPRAVNDAAGLASSAWRVSARHSHVDRLVRPVVELPYHLTDAQGVFEATTSGGGRLRISGYSGIDDLDLTSVEDFPIALRWRWGNDVLGVRWTRDSAGYQRDGEAGSGAGVDGRGRSDVTLHAGYSRFSTSMRFPDFDDTVLDSRIERAGGGGEMGRVFGTGGGAGTVRVHGAARAGGIAEHYRFRNLAAGGGTELTRAEGDGLLLEGFLELGLRWGDRWSADAGVRLSHWDPDPGSTVIVPAPRLALRRGFAGGRAALTLSAGRHAQFLHSLRNEELPLGLDVWMLAGERAPHVVSDQAELALEVRPGRRLTLTLEAYLREFSGVAAPNRAADPNDPRDELVEGSGRSVGADLSLRHAAPPADSGGRSWMVAVSWLRATRTFPDTESAVSPPPLTTHPPVFDRRLSVDLLLRQPLPGGVEAAVRWSYGSGLPYTRPLAAFEHLSPVAAGDRRPAIILGPRNGARYPPYHRLDLGVRRTFTPSWGRITPYLDVLNAYDRRNVLFWFHDFEADPPTRSGISMFPVLPTFGVEVSFR